MKKTSFFVVALLAVFLSASSHPQFIVFSQIESRTAQDRELAGRIRQLTNRSTEGLTQSQTAKGGVSLGLEERFQNVMLSQIGADGNPRASCVTSVEEANDFFGRNLETGEILNSSFFRQGDADTTAARHGMSRDEFEFYKRLIEEAAIRRAQSPNAATINIINADSAGEGFNDPTATTSEGGNNGATRGEQRLNLFNFAAGIWGAFLDTNVPIDVNAQFNPLTPCSSSGGVLGSAGTNTINRDFPGAEFPGTWYHAALANKRAGSDLDATFDISTRFNSDVDNGCLGAGSRFYYGLDNVTPSGRINLLIVLLHELGHGLGFSSFVNGTSGALFSGFPDIYTRYMYDRTTGKYWYQMTNAERQASALNSNNVFWDGANVRIASDFLVNGREAGTGRVALFTPTTFQSGSSISHFSTLASPNLLMEPNINVGIPLTLDLTRQQMRDVGWYRDTTADLVPDTIINVQPSSGTLIVGSSVNITWTNTGGFSRNVTVELSADGGTTWTAIASDVPNTGSLNFTVPNTITAQGRIRVRETNFVQPAGVSTANFGIGIAPLNRTKFDFDGDGKADVSVFRPSSGTWYLQQSTNGFSATQFGLSGDKIVPADYDGDGKTDIAVFRSGTWYLQRSSLGFTGTDFGISGDVPVPGDYDADGKADLAVFRPSNGVWYLQRSTAGFTGIQFGATGDKLTPADFDGDGKTDLAVFRPSVGAWYIQRSQAGFTGVSFGTSEDIPAPADYDADGKADIAVFRPSNGTWYLQRSQLGFTGVQFGQSGDVPVAADYDGDGRADLAVYRDTIWYLNRTTAGFTGIQFGTGGDTPIPAAGL